MSTYNTIADCEILCPRCGQVVRVNVDTYFGDTSQMKELQIGGEYPWGRGNRTVRNGGRPEGGNLDNGEGYAECPSCKKDFFLFIRVCADKIDGVKVNEFKNGYVPD